MTLAGQLARRALAAAAVPALYGLLFVALTWPAAARFTTHILADDGDGFQMYWNVWWVRHALLGGADHPFTTHLLFYPETPSLLTHSLHPFAGLLTLPLAPLLGDVALFNVVVVFAFAFAGWGAYLLARHLGAARPGALIGGYVFTFCSYHFAHAQGHLNLVLLQWIPFYLLFLLRLIEGNRARDGVVAALLLFSVLLCDHYYFLFCVLATGIVVAWAVVARRLAGPPRRLALPWAGFLLVVLGTSGAYALAFLRAAGEGSVGGHPDVRGLDLLALLIPGGHWRWHDLTAFYWQRLGENIHETSVHVGAAALVLAGCGWRRLRQAGDGRATVLLLVLGVFFALSLGRDLRLFGHALALPMPYEALEALAPPVRLGGVPVRFVVMVVLVIAVLAACGAQQVARGRRGRLALGLLVGLMIVELMPRPVPSTRVTFPAYVGVLARRAETEPGAVLDLVNPSRVAMVYQTRHRQPIQSGYLARTPLGARRTWNQVNDLVQEQRFAELRARWGFRYVLSHEPLPGCRQIFGGPVQIHEILDRSDLSGRRP
jgi:hypothetical protein